jgi:hypothetical protein
MKIKKISQLTPEEMALHFCRFFENDIFRIAVHSLIMEGVCPNKTEEYKDNLKKQIDMIKKTLGE